MVKKKLGKSNPDEMTEEDKRKRAELELLITDGKSGSLA
jgi:hypothetical protein